MRTYAVEIALVAALVAMPAPAGASGLETVLQDDAQLLHRPEDQLRRSLQEMRLLGVDRIRVTAGWSVLTHDPDAESRPADFDATDPAAYEQDRWRNLDRLLILAREYGFKTMIDIGFWAPKWASDDPPGTRGRTNPDPVEFSQFAVAVARRYSGAFRIPQAPAMREFPILGSDERFLRTGFGSSSPQGETSLASLLGIALLPMRESVESRLFGGEFAGRSPLPKVDVFTIWNEPNHTGFLRPQWQWQRLRGRWVPRSPHMYRRMLQFAYPAVKQVRPDATLLVGATSYTGARASRGVGGVPPLRFLRELACVNRRYEPLRRPECRAFTPIPGDGWSHHPYTMQTEPDHRSPASRPDDVPLADLGKLHRALVRLAGKGRMSAANQSIWVTEYGYETNPPDHTEKYTVGDQAKFLSWAEYLVWRRPFVKTFAQFLLRDLPPGAFRVGTSTRRPFGEWQSGLLFEDGTPKLASASFRAGLFAERLARGRVRLWARLRTGSGQRLVKVQTRRAGGRAWRPLATYGPGAHRRTRSWTVEGHGVMHRFARLPDRRRERRYRLVYLEGSTWRTSPSVTAVWR
jgi:hypothetical protein